MAFSEETKAQILRNAGNKCECTRQCSYHKGRRCNAALYTGTGNWNAHHKTAVASGGDTASNGEAFCLSCHQNTETYGP